MKLRTFPLAIAAAAAVLVPTFGVAPAYALPSAPTIANPDTTVAGHVSGDAQTDQPFVFVGLRADQSDAASLDSSGGSAHFDLTVWGYANVVVHAWACPADLLDANCSADAAFDAGAPTDVAVTPTFSADTTVGPADQVTVDPDDTGGGVLFAQWVGANPGTKFSVQHTGTTVVPTVDGTGTVHIFRCDNPSQDHCVEEAVSDPYTVKQNATAAIGPVTGVSDAAPTTTFDVTTPGAGTGTGTYTVTWHLELASDPGTPIDGYGTTTPTAALATGVAQDVPLDATGLPEGDYTIVGTITVVDTDYGTYTAIPMTGGTLHSGGDVTPPAISAITASPTKIYPLISGNSTYRSTTKITVTGAGVPEITALRIYQKSTGTLVRGPELSQVDPTHATVTWNGRKSNGTAVPAGTYLIKVRDAAGNVSPTIGSVSVSGYKLVTKTWTRTFSPAGTLADSYVGKCSTLREPSLRGWYHSFGYYANTRCGSQTSKDSLISTLHVTFLPKAVQYVDIHVNAYGGAARAKPGSKARIRYLTTSSDPAKQWASTRTISSTLGTHAGYTRSTSGLVFKDRSFGWGIYTGFGYQYDIKSFTVVLHYKVLG